LKKTIAKFDLKKLTELCRQNDIVYLGVFGSYARGEPRPSSDIDLLAVFSKIKSLLELVRIERKFAELLGKKVDLLTEASISPYLRNKIKQETVVVYEER
jgi:hypothetical protein